MDGRCATGVRLLGPLELIIAGFVRDVSSVWTTIVRGNYLFHLCSAFLISCIKFDLTLLIYSPTFTNMLQATIVIDATI